VALVKLSALRLHLGIAPKTSTEGDSLLTALETQAVSYLSALSGWDLDTVAEVTDYYSGSGTAILPLRGVPDTGETFTVYERVDDSWDSIDSTDYQVIVDPGGASARLLKFSGSWEAGDHNHKVVATRGYTSTTCPGLLPRAILDLVLLWYRKRKTAPPTLGTDQTASALEGVSLPASVNQWLDLSNSNPEPIFSPPLQRM